MKPITLAIIIIRGHALALFVVGSVATIQLAYCYLDPALTDRISKIGTVRYSLATMAFEFISAFALFILSGHIGKLILYNTESK